MEDNKTPLKELSFWDDIQFKDAVINRIDYLSDRIDILKIKIKHLERENKSLRNAIKTEEEL